MGWDKNTVFTYTCDCCGWEEAQNPSAKVGGYIDKWRHLADALLPDRWVKVSGIGYFCSQECADIVQSRILKEETCSFCGYRLYGAYNVQHTIEGHLGWKRGLKGGAIGETLE